MTTSSQTHRDLAGASWLTRSETRAVFNALEHSGFEARAVGGSVRNALIGLPVNDVDIATTATPEQVVAAAAAAGLAAHPTGIDHGTITVVSGRIPHEVTTLRRDVETDGRRAVVAYSTDWSEDAGRRDFTINALYADKDGRIFDPLGTGLADLEARAVRFIGDGGERIREDYLRILRFFRFSAHYASGHLDAAGLEACARNRAGLSRLSAERVQAEVLKIFAAEPQSLRAVVAAMLAHGFLASGFRAAPYPGRLARWLDLETSLELTPDPLARLAALVLAGPYAVAALSKRLRLSGGDRARAESFASGLEAAKAPTPGLPASRAALYELGADAYRDKFAFAWLQSGVGVSDAGRRAAFDLATVWSPPKLPVTGADAIQLGAAPGRALGDALDAVEAAWIGSDFALDRESCLALLREEVSRRGAV